MEKNNRVNPNPNYRPPIHAAKRGNWIGNRDGTHFCSECGRDALYERVSDTYFKEYLPDVCCHCGAVMRINECLEDKT